MITFQRFMGLTVCVCLALAGGMAHGHGGYGGGGFGGYGGWGGGGFNWGSLFNGGGGGWGGHHYGHRYGGGHQYTPRRSQPTRNYVTRPTPPPTYVAPKKNTPPRTIVSNPPKTVVKPVPNTISSQPKKNPVAPLSNGSALTKATAPKTHPPKALATSPPPKAAPKGPVPGQYSTRDPNPTPAPRTNQVPTVVKRTTGKPGPAPENPAHESFAAATPHNPPPKTKATPNPSIHTIACSLPAADKARLSDQLKQKSHSLVDQLDHYMENLVGETLAKVPGAHDLPPAKHKELIDAINDGDLDHVKAILGPTGIASEPGQYLLNIADLQQDLDRIRGMVDQSTRPVRVVSDPPRSLRSTGDPNGNGQRIRTDNTNPLAEGAGIGAPMNTVTGGGVDTRTGNPPTGPGNMSNTRTGGPGGDPGAALGNFTQAVNDAFPPNVAATINNLVAQIAVTIQVQMWIDAAILNLNPIPPGPNVPIALIPGLPPGLILPLGFGPTLIGMGPGDQIFLGEGDVTEVAGMPEPIGPPVEDLTGPVATGRIVLTNVGVDVINYNVNQQPFSMQPRFQQTLTDGASWVVEFDRGGGNGMARYTLTEGTYEFTPTQTGWDLFKKTFRVQLENMLETEFNYVVSDQQQVIGAGAMQDLSGPIAPVVTFDNGRGQTLQKQLDGTAYRIALAQDDTFNIYPAESVPTPATQSVEVPVVTTGESPAPADAVAAAPVQAEPTAVASTAAVPSDTPAVAAAEPVIAAPVAAAPIEAPVPATGVATPATAVASVTPPTTVVDRPGIARVETRRVNLPAGFRLFDPVAALTPAPVTRSATSRTTPGRRLPVEFTLFEAAQAAQRAVGGGL